MLLRWGGGVFPGLQLYQKETPTQLFSGEYCEIFKNTYFEEHLQTVAFQALDLLVTV